MNVETNVLINFENSLNQLKNSITQISERTKELKKELSLCDLRNTAVDHIAEFADFDEQEGLMIAKELQSILVRRREIKDELSILEAADQSLEARVGDLKDLDIVMKTVKNKMRKMEYRTYAPKVELELFEKLKHKMKNTIKS